MKKIININLSGRVLPIEEPAYEQLQSYIASLRKHFAQEESRDEIINDIEGRIAEILHDKVQRGLPCINDEHIHDVITVMGRPEELTQESIALETESNGSTTATGEFSARSASASTGTGSRHEIKEDKKFFRDNTNRIFGGIASGIANYLDIDPAIIRAVFVLMAFSSFGFFMLAYILVWILVPAKELERYHGKRFYRNPEDRIFGGVASGLAAYFDRPTRNVRLLFLSPLLLQILLSVFDVFEGVKAELFFNIGLGSFTSLSLLTYIILWIILPKAETPYQKMEMRGEKVDAERIRRHVNEGAEAFKEKMKDWGQEVEQSAKRFSERAEQFADEAQKRDNILVRFFRAIFRGIGLIFKIFFSVLFGGIAFVLLVVLAALLFGGIVSWPLQNFIWSSPWQQWLAWSAFALFFFVPVVGFLVWLIRRLLGVRRKNSYWGWTFGGLWTLGWVALMLFISSVAKDFNYQEKIKTEVTLANPGLNNMYVTVSQPALEYSNSIGWINGDGEGWDITHDTLSLSNVMIRVEASPDTAYHVQLIRTAIGKTLEAARERAEAINYTISNSTASGTYSKVQYSPSGDTLLADTKGFRHILLDLGSGYSIPASSRYRIQQVTVLIRVPVGKTLAFDESVRKKLHQGEFKVFRKNNGRFKGVEWKDQKLFYESGVEYIMTPGGELKRADGKPEESILNDDPGSTFTPISEIPALPPIPAIPKAPAIPAIPLTSSVPPGPSATPVSSPVNSACGRTMTPSPLNALLWG